MGSVVTLDFLEAGNSSVNQYVKRSTQAAGASPGHYYVVGVAAETQPYGGSGSTAVIATPISVWDCNPNVEFKAATINATLQSSNVGQTKKLHWDSTNNINVVDLGASTNTDHRVVITKLIDQQGDSGGYVAFRFLTDYAFQGSTVLSSTPFLAFYRR
jgi:hypothetical protein